MPRRVKKQRLSASTNLEQNLTECPIYTGQSRLQRDMSSKNTWHAYEVGRGQVLYDQHQQLMRQLHGEEQRTRRHAQIPQREKFRDFLSDISRYCHLGGKTADCPKLLHYGCKDKGELSSFSVQFGPILSFSSSRRKDLPTSTKFLPGHYVVKGRIFELFCLI
jgi:hypothetical protein